MSKLFKKLLDLFSTNEEPLQPEAKEEPHRMTHEEMDAYSKASYEEGLEERRDLEERAAYALMKQGHTTPGIVKYTSNRELINIIWEYERSLKKDRKD